MAHRALPYSIRLLPPCEAALDREAPVATFLFTDIEGSTALWERQPERMRPAMAEHDRTARAAVEAHAGTVVKMTGDGLHAVFVHARDALEAALAIQHALVDIAARHEIALRARCGMHQGGFERRDGDFHGPVVNRAARIMAAAHGGQTLLSEAVATALGGALPEAVSLRDLGAARLRDLASSERLYQLVHPALRADFPPLRSLEHTPNNLPHALNAFIGRERELASVSRLLRENRLVTLVGMGGLGKSRLSLHVAAEAMDDHPDGVWLVELAPLRDPARVAQAIASALGAQPEAGQPIEEALERHVRERSLLVVLDNCEHLVEACGAIARRLLSAGVRLHVLATSREPLRVAGEVAFPIAGLGVPGALGPLDHTVSRYDAVRLFVERATAALPGFELTDDNAPAVASICHRVDGIPLALELAAARVRALAVTEIAARMKDRFKLLTAGDPTALPRQRTLRAMIDWSYDLLPREEQALFRQLAVFSGGWTLEAAEAVCACEEHDVLDLLSRLVEKSLVVFDRAHRRYHLLETVHQYAYERLDEHGAMPEAQGRHLEYYVALAESAKPHLMGPDQGTWLTRLDEERENLLAAHAWAQHCPHAGETGLRLVNALKFYWLNRGLLELGHRVSVEALSHEGARADNLLRCQGLFHAGWLRYCMGLYGNARELLEDSLRIARALGNDRAIGAILQPLGFAAAGLRDYAAAESYLQEALALAKAQPDQRELAAAMNALGQLLRVQGLPEKAHPLYEEVVRLLRAIGDEEAAGLGLLNLAMVAAIEGNAPGAAGMVRDALDASERTQSRPLLQSALEVCAGLAAQRRDWRDAARFYGAAEAHASRTGVRRDPADEAFLGPRIELTHAALGDSPFAAALADGRALTRPDAIGELRAWLDAFVGSRASPEAEVRSR